jgi:hypothetical protein
MATRAVARTHDETTDQTTELSEIAARAKLIFATALEWRNWQTQQTQNLLSIKSNH